MFSLSILKRLYSQSNGFTQMEALISHQMFYSFHFIGLLVFFVEPMSALFCKNDHLFMCGFLVPQTTKTLIILR